MGRPSQISGSCLCGAICYTVSFNEDQWPPRSDICQCTMCRKFTASLFPQMLTLKADQIHPSLSSFPSYQEFQSSLNRYRGFCSTCGSSLIWRSAGSDDFDLFLGTIDEKWLIGERVDGTETSTPYGTAVGRQGGFINELCVPRGTNCYHENTLPGVADCLPGGQKFPVTYTDKGSRPSGN
ncbi:Mss4-like protein [Aspergillus floccosus]